MLTKASKQHIEELITFVNNRKDLLLSDNRLSEYFKDSQVVSHVEAGDFFATTATVLRLARERLQDRYGGDIVFENEIMEELEQELIYLHKHYSIVEKK